MSLEQGTRDFREGVVRHRRDASAVPEVPPGKLVETLARFARALRTAGVPVGPGKVLTACRVLEQLGLGRRDDVYWALHATFVERHEQTALFDQAFHVFFRNPKLLDRLRSLLLPQIETGLPPSEEQMRELSRRLSEALYENREREAEQAEEREVEIEATLTWSDQEQLRTADFEKMSTAEMAQARRMIERLRLPVRPLKTRRFRLDPRGRRIDPRASFRAGLRTGGDLMALRRRSRRQRPPALVVLCDISGSMAQYSRMFLFFLHALTNHRDRVHSFLFGTRLTNITRDLRRRDVDEAVERISERAQDWSGGTRIGATLDEFNRAWSRRVLGQGAVVLLVTDGLDRENAEGLGESVARLHRSCRRLIWLNPLLRWEGYQPKSMGARAILPHVDEFRPIHNLESLEQLAEVLSRPMPRRLEAARDWHCEEHAP